MRILSLHIFKWNENGEAFALKSSFELGHISWMKRPFAKGPLLFGSRTTVSRVKPGLNVCVKLEEMEDCLVYAAVKPNKLAAVAVTDSQYPDKVAVKVCHDIMKEFEMTYGMQQVEFIKEDTEFSFNRLDQLIVKFQDPKECDKLMKIEDQLVETQKTLHTTMEQLMQRGEKLDDLMEKSNDISKVSLDFYKNAKKANRSCCSLY